MKIAIINQTSGGMSGGYKKYLREVIPHLASAPEILDILCLYPDTVNVHDFSFTSDKVQYISYSPTFMVRSVKCQIWKHLQSFNPDILFFPSARVFPFQNIPTVRMIQNMEPFVKIDGNPIIERLANFARERQARKVARVATRVIAISEFVSQFMTREWDVSPGRIDLIYLGTEKPGDNDDKMPIVVPDSWDRHFLFTAGSIRPARGLEDLLLAMKFLKRSTDVAGLVIAGKVDRRMEGYKARLVRYISGEGLTDKVVWADLLDAQEMSWCYKHCLAFVMTSRVEACPNIALEAMAHGCVCISTDSAPMPEFFDKTASYYPSGDGERLGEIVRDVVSLDGQTRLQVGHRSANRAENYSWDTTLKETINVLKKASDSRFHGCGEDKI